ncbi:transcription factor bHLH92 isoform X1 [Ricinus communis]|uniref:transcription factor bHLH92 isoform X1 n=1 Tax=Ricinus communis TaxID=3988 RepID=UPI00201AA706|nr:transcription factor bHLH92 isoform X1 [Ricinus communis]
MDHFFGEECLQIDAFWDVLGPVLDQSAFQPYTSIPRSEIAANRSNSTNMNKRMIEFMKRSFPVVTTETQKSDDSTRCYRRKMSERLRRETEKTGYLALYSVLPPGTKKDKNSIMQMASKRIQELKGSKEVLERRNYELEVKLEEMRIRNESTSGKIQFKVHYPGTSGMTYMVEVLKCLNSLGSKIRSIESSFSDQGIAAVMDIETQISEAEVRKEVQRTLEDLQWKLQFHFLEY